MLDFEGALPIFFVPVLSFLARAKARDVRGLKSADCLSLLTPNLGFLRLPEGTSEQLFLQYRLK
jgi:hypothetical protein